MSLDSAIQHLLAAKRISAPSQSYAKDNPVEWEKVKAYLEGGPRPTGVVTEMGLGLIEVEDERRSVTPPSAGVEIPTYSVTWPAGSTAYWILGDSATTQRHTGSGTAGMCMVVWSTDGGMPSALYSGREMWALAGMRMVTGKPKRSLNWHCAPSDQPYGWYPLNYAGGSPTPGGTGNSNGVSPFSVDYPGHDGNPNMCLGIKADQTRHGLAYNRVIMSEAEAESRRGQWIWLWFWIRLGRNDGSPVDGAAKVWVAGEDTPRVDVTGINTIWYGQHQVTYWQGGYWSNNTTPAGGVVIEHALTRFGRTPQECFEAVPTLLTGYGATQTGSGGPGSHTQITSRLHNEAAIPADLRWS